METTNQAFWDIYTDGASSPQGQKASIGAVLYSPDKSIVDNVAGPLPMFVHSAVAEYNAIIAGLQLAQKHKATHVRVHSDCATVLGQMKGECKVKAAYMKPYYESASAFATQFLQVDYVIIKREENVEAHDLAQKALGIGKQSELEPGDNKAIEEGEEITSVALPTKEEGIVPLATPFSNALGFQQGYWQIVGNELCVWRIHHLWNSAYELPTKKVPLKKLEHLLASADLMVNESVTLRKFVEIASRIRRIDKNKPILLDADGALVDGGLQLARAVYKKNKNIKVQQLKHLPAPDARFPLT